VQFPVSFLAVGGVCDVSWLIVSDNFQDAHILTVQRLIFPKNIHNKYIFTRKNIWNVGTFVGGAPNITTLE